MMASIYVISAKKWVFQQQHITAQNHRFHAFFFFLLVMPRLPKTSNFVQSSRTARDDDARRGRYIYIYYIPIYIPGGWCVSSCVIKKNGVLHNHQQPPPPVYRYIYPQYLSSSLVCDARRANKSFCPRGESLVFYSSLCSYFSFNNGNNFSALNGIYYIYNHPSPRLCLREGI